MSPLIRIALFLFWLTSLFPLAALADPPGRVGRIAVLDGPALLRVDRQDAGSAASLNWPIAAGAIVDTDPGARAEIWVGSTAVRLGSRTRLEFSRLDDERVILNLGEGALSVTLRDNQQAAEMEAHTPGGRIRFAGPGRYRIDTAEGRTNVSVHAGSALVDGRDRSLSVSAGRAASIDPDGRATLYGELLHDALDDWAMERDRATLAATAIRHVSPEMTGYADLDAYGDWGAVADYGTVWYPRGVPVGWAPYRQGRWAWVEPWGWTWIDEAPWGFAPFHYGRWLHIRGRWAWVPGTRAARPIYAPALVAWVGDGGWSLSVGSGPAVGWFPLGPREVFLPSYRCSDHYLRRVNAVHVRRDAIDRAAREGGGRRFAYSHRPDAVTVVASTTFRSGRSIDPVSTRPPRETDLRGAPVSPRSPDIRRPAAPDSRPRPGEAPGVAPESAGPAGRPGNPDGREYGRQVDPRRHPDPTQRTTAAGRREAELRSESASPRQSETPPANEVRREGVPGPAPTPAPVITRETAPLPESKPHPQPPPRREAVPGIGAAPGAATAERPPSGEAPAEARETGRAPWGRDRQPSVDPRRPELPATPPSRPAAPVNPVAPGADAPLPVARPHAPARPAEAPQGPLPLESRPQPVPPVGASRAMGGGPSSPAQSDPMPRPQRPQIPENTPPHPAPAPVAAPPRPPQVEPRHEPPPRGDSGGHDAAARGAPAFGGRGQESRPAPAERRAQPGKERPERQP